MGLLSIKAIIVVKCNPVQVPSSASSQLPNVYLNMPLPADTHYIMVHGALTGFADSCKPIFDTCSTKHTERKHKLGNILS